MDRELCCHPQSRQSNRLFIGWRLWQTNTPAPYSNPLQTSRTEGKHSHSKDDHYKNIKKSIKEIIKIVYRFVFSPPGEILS